MNLIIGQHSSANRNRSVIVLSIVFSQNGYPLIKSDNGCFQWDFIRFREAFTKITGNILFFLPKGGNPVLTLKVLIRTMVIGNKEQFYNRYDSKTVQCKKTFRKKEEKRWCKTMYDDLIIFKLNILPALPILKNKDLPCLVKIQTISGCFFKASLI